MDKIWNETIRKKICLVLTVCWMAVIFAFSARNAELSTGDSTSVGMMFGQMFVPGFDEMDTKEQMAFADMIDHPVRKTAHATEYAVLGFLIAGSYDDRTKKRLKLILVPLLTGALYAVSDEIHQLFVPGRSCQISDLLLDSCGVLAGTLAGMLIFTYKRRRVSRKQSA